MPPLTITHCWLMLRRTMIRCKQVMMRWMLPRRCPLFARGNNRDEFAVVGEAGEGRDIGAWNGHVCHRHDGHERDAHKRDIHEHDAHKGRHYISAGPSPVPSRDYVNGGGELSHV